MDTLMADIRALGRLPRRKEGLGDEYALACRLREAKRQRLLSESQLSELTEIARSANQPLPEDDEPADPLDPLADDAANRLEQDVLMARSGMRPRRGMERVARYKKYMTQLGGEELDVVQKYKDQVLQAAASSSAPARYVPGDEIDGDSLRSFSACPAARSGGSQPASSHR